MHHPREERKERPGRSSYLGEGLQWRGTGSIEPRKEEDTNAGKKK